MTTVVHITSEQTEQIRHELLRALERLNRSVDRNGSAKNVDLDQTAVGRLSRIEAIQNQGLTNGLRERERIQLEQVLDALRRMDDGCYGTCTSCHGSIPYERLVVFPETRTCTPCG